MQDPQTTESDSQQRNLESTHLALVRTQFALMRTGFTIASFGAGVSEVVGRDNWPDWATNSVTSLFVISGMVLVQAALVTSSQSARELGVEDRARPFMRFAIKTVPWLMQAGLLALLVFVLMH